MPHTYGEPPRTPRTGSADTASSFDGYADRDSVRTSVPADLPAHEVSPPAGPGFVRVPGVLCRSEISQVVRPGAEFYVELAGELGGVEVFHVFQRSRSNREVGIPATVVLDDGTMPLHVRLLPISREPLMAILTVEGDGDTGRVREHLAEAEARFRAVPPTRAGTGGRR
jgi:hypothetical protein